MRVRVGTRAHVSVCVGVGGCVCARVWARMRVRALVHAGVRACVREYACMIYHTRLSNMM